MSITINNSSVTRLLYRAPYCNVIMMARLSGDVNKELLGSALKKARMKYPLLNSRIQQDRNGVIEFLYDCNKEFPIIVEIKNTDSEWIEAGWNEQKKPFDIQNGPLIKFLLLKSAGTSDLVIICHHCICDGLSLVYLAKDIAFYLSNPGAEVEPLPLPPPLSIENLSVRVRPGIIGKLTGLLAWFLNRSWNKSKVVFSEHDYQQLYKEYWEAKDIGLLAFSITKDISTMLVEKCHAEQVTVNSALTTAFSLAQHDLQGENEPYLKKALLAINIRHLFKEHPGDNFGLLAVGNEINLPSGKGRFWDIAGRFNAEIKKMLADPKNYLAMVSPLDSVEPTLLDAIYFAESGCLRNKAATRLKNIVLSKTGKPKRSLDITNLGVVKDHDDNLKTIFFLPILSTNYEKTFGIVTIDGEINIVLMHDRSVIDSGIIMEYRQKIMRFIEENI